MPTGSATKGSHYLPRTYLKHFLLRDEIFMYKKGEGFFRPQIQTAQRILRVQGEAGLNAIGLENNLYLPEIPKLTSNDIEEIFRECGEDDLNETITTVEGMHDGASIDQETKRRLCVFIAAMRVRTPFFKKEAEEVMSVLQKHVVSSRMQSATIAELRNEMALSGLRCTDREIDDARTVLLNQEYELEYPNSFFIKFALSGIEKYASIFHQMKLTLHRNTGNRYFITSDNPVVYFVPKSKTNFYNPPRGLMSPHSELFFALTRNLGVNLSRYPQVKEMVMPASRKIVDLFNYNISHNSDNFLFSPLKMKFLDQFVEEYVPYPFKLTMS